MRRLIRTYTVWELIYQIWDQQNANRVEQKKKTKKKRRIKQVCSSGAFFNHSQLELKRPFDLLDTPTAPGVLQSQCIHMSHKQINYQTAITVDSCSPVYRKKDSEVLIF